MGTYVIGFGLLALTVALTMVAIAMTIGEPDAPTPPARWSPPTTPDRLRLRIRPVFARRTPQAIVVDALLVAVDQGPAGAVVTAGLPFAVALRLPDTAWFAVHVDELLEDWCEDGDVVTLDIVDTKGRLRATIASHESSVHLDLVDTAGLPQPLASSRFAAG